MHQHDLPALDHFLNLVLAAIARRAIRNLFHGVRAADRLDDFFVLAIFVFVELHHIGFAVPGRRRAFRFGGIGVFGGCVPGIGPIRRAVIA